MEEKIVSFEIYFSDLNEDAKRRLLDAVGIDDPKEMNWDIDMCPIAIYETIVTDEPELEPVLEVGKTYKMSDYEVVCTGYTKGGKAKMQTCGMTSGPWPDGDISGYNDVTARFTKEWEGVIKKFKAPTLKKAEKNGLVRAALVKAAREYSSFGASYSYSWLGTVGGGYYAWCVNSGGNVVHYCSYQDNSFVVAPAFNLDASKVILNGDEIKVKEVAA